MVMLDFGNGIYAYDDGLPGISDKATGLDVPQFEVAVNEYGVLDGGAVGGSRAKMRRMTIPVLHDAQWTRDQIMEAFTPGVERTISTPRGSMPYYVEALIFPSSLIKARKMFTVSIVSPYAYPVGDLLTLSAQQAQQISYTTTSYMTGTAYGSTPRMDASKLNARIWQTIGSFSAGEYVGEAGFKLENIQSYGDTAYFRLYATSGGVPTGNPLETIARSVYSGTRNVTATFNYAVTSTGTYAVICEFNPSNIRPFRDSAAGHAGGIGGHYTDSGGWIIGVGGDSTIDWAHLYTKGVVAATTTTAYLDPQTQLPADPKVTVTLGSATSSLTITDGTRTATLTGTMNQNDVVVLDCANRTVMVNGTNRFSWFSRMGDWPRLEKDTGFIQTNVAGTIEVEWRPRMMGLL